MDGYGLSKKYESFKIPGRLPTQEDGVGELLPQKKDEPLAELADGMFYEIEYGANPIPGVGKFVLKSQKIAAPPRDEIRELFDQMRGIARAYRSYYDHSKFYAWLDHQNKGLVFYKQGLFMKDFTDNYPTSVPFTQYYPNYNMMGYEQLRSYFTWRTEVRKGNVVEVSLSYAFLYIYELLSNIGANDPQDALDKLMFFWQTFRVYDHTIDRYVLRWLKDFHVYYELPHSFKEFIEKNQLTGHYPEMVDNDNDFTLYCSLAKYDIRKSAFYTRGNEKLVTDCFYHVVNRIRQALTDIGVNLDQSLFLITRKTAVWIPFDGALFYQWLRQRDRRVVLSKHEIYQCSRNRWVFSKMVTFESGKQLIGYIMKQMESVLRRITGYKRKLTAKINLITHPVVEVLSKSGDSLERIVNDATLEFYREATKTVVTVDPQALSLIRREALATQEKLIVPEQTEQPTEVILARQYQKEQHDAALLLRQQQETDRPVLSALDLSSEKTQVELQLGNESIPETNQDKLLPENAQVALSKPWEDLRNALTPVEIGALAVVLHSEKDLKQYADETGVMLEVLVDGINEKALDHIGDSLLDEEFVLYDDYMDQIEELL